MTVEELNIKIIADSQDFCREIQSVNEALEKTKQLSAEAQKAVSSVFSGVYTETAAAEETAAGTYAIPAAAGGAAKAAQTAYEYFGGAAAAEVLNLSSRETVIGAVSRNEKETASEQPIKINTTIELDGDRIGEAASLYMMRRGRITNGLSD